jgi:putative oxidoreductase
MLNNPLHWMDMGKPSEISKIFQDLGAFSVFGGGIAIILGFKTSLAALGLVISMAIAFLFMGESNPYPQFVLTFAPTP